MGSDKPGYLLSIIGAVQCRKSGIQESRRYLRNRGAELFLTEKGNLLSESGDCGEPNGVQDDAQLGKTGPARRAVRAS